MYACNGILFNHESPIRGETFVTRKITRALARIKLGLQKKLYMGNLNAKRDWGHAKDFVEAQWLILQQDSPEDYVIATGIQHSVRDFINVACDELKFEIKWKGHGLEEKGIINGKETIMIDPRYFRPTEVDNLLGDPTKAKKKLKWNPEISFKELVNEMITEDVKAVEKEIYLSNKYDNLN
jgi:GDPmannose 4,6-dehydratase